MTDKRAYDLTDQATLDTNSYLVVDQSGWATARRMQGSVLDSYFVEVAGDAMTGDLTFSGAFHPVVAPGSDTDAVLLEVTVTGTPALSWDESEDATSQNKGHRITSGKLGVGTSDVPHGAIGAAMLALEGANANVAGPHLQFTTASDDYPLLQLMNWQHDNMALMFDSYFDGVWKSSDAGSNFRIRKNSDKLQFDYESGIAAGNAATFVSAMTIDTNSNVGIRATSPSARLHVDQNASGGAIPVLLLDQADIDLEFIKLVGSSQDGEADRSLVDAADMTTPGALVGWIQIYVEDVQGTNPIADGVYYIPFYAAPSA